MRILFLLKPNRPLDHIAVVILNWNGIDFLKKFLPKVVEYSQSDAQVWVIDNGSTDESIAYLQEVFPSVKLVDNKENYGFAKGYNVGLKKVDAEYYILLNSDVEVTPNWIPPVLAYMKKGNIAACQPKIRDFHRKTHFEHAGAAGGFLDRDGFPFCAGRIMDSFEEDFGQYDDNHEIFWASGAALFVRANLYNELNGLDEDFFAHMEEIDLCWRIKNQGHKVGRCGDSIVYHVGGGTLNKINPFKTFLNFRNNLFLLTKNYYHGFFFGKIFKRMLLDGVAGVKFLSEGKFNYCWAVIKAHFSFYANFGLMYKKRIELKKKSPSPNMFGWYNKSILLEYFFRNKKKFSDLNDDNFRK